jgi:plasmid stabilization system protein ParE
VTTRRVIFSPEALADLLALYDYIADEAGAGVALGYVERIEAHCRRLDAFPERGTVRSDIRPGLRIIGFERRVTIAYHVEPEAVVINRILYGGRNIETAFH